MRDWPEPVERVARAVRDAGVDARIEEFADGTPTAEDAARAAGCTLAQIVKSLVFDCDGRSVIVMVPGDRRADPKKIAAGAGCANARVAGRAQVEAATGFEPGAVAPFPLPAPTSVFIDPSLFAHDEVWIGAGSTHHMAAIAPTDLARLAKARPLDASA